eukprot:756209-Pleurochrysis_carterae.AAC.1
MPGDLRAPQPTAPAGKRKRARTRIQAAAEEPGHAGDGGARRRPAPGRPDTHRRPLPTGRVCRE